jgi:hypothetical protein
MAEASAPEPSADTARSMSFRALGCRFRPHGNFLGRFGREGPLGEVFRELGDDLLRLFLPDSLQARQRGNIPCGNRLGDTLGRQTERLRRAPGADPGHFDEQQKKSPLGRGEETHQPRRERLARGHVSFEVVMGVKLDGLLRPHEGLKLGKSVASHLGLVAESRRRPQDDALVEYLYKFSRNPPDHCFTIRTTPERRSVRSMWQ